MQPKAIAGELTEERQWHDAFLVHPSLASFAAHKRYLRRLTEEQWASAGKLLEEGFTLGVVANASEAVDAVAEASARLKLPLLAQYDEEATIVYLCLDEEWRARSDPPAGDGAA